MEDSPIRHFFEGQTLFLTGGTGFLGKVLLEKLLRACYGLDKIYVLVRPKKGKSREERFATLFDYPCFDRLKKERPKFKHQVRLVSGDCELSDLGLDPQDVAILQKEVTCVIHASANVKFDQTLKEATYNNVRPLKVLLEIAKGMALLKSFIFVSTAYSNCIHFQIKEEFYEPPTDADTLLTLLDNFDDNTLEKITPSLLGKWPNTYVYTKCVAENLIKTQGTGLPVAIVRPAIVTSSIREPLPGWIDNFYGVAGIVVAASLGVLRSMNVKPECTAWLVPVDFVSNMVITSAWDIFENRSVRKPGEIPIYNYVGFKTINVSWRRVMQYFEKWAWDYPTERQLWYYSFTMRENVYWHKICVFFLHTVPAYLVDFILICLGRPTLAVANYNRLNKLMDLISYFSSNSFDFDVDNVLNLWARMTPDDQELFKFNLQTSETFNQYTKDSIMGARLYLLKETLDTIPKGQRKLRILMFAHYTVVALVCFFLYKLVMFLLSFIW